MSSRPELKIDWCSYQAAKYACEHWHYSKTQQAGKSVKIGVWEDGKFIGCLIFTMGSGSGMPLYAKRLGLADTGACELSRVALTTHKTPVSRIIRIALKFLKEQSPGLELVISYADTGQGHHGGIYQASGWVYVGLTTGDTAWIDRTGKRYHRRSVSKTGTTKMFGKTKKTPLRSELTMVRTSPKHKYLFPLTEEIRKKVEPLAKSYPKRPSSIDNDAATNQVEKGGAIPTDGLHFTE